LFVFGRNKKIVTISGEAMPEAWNAAKTAGFKVISAI